MRDLERLHRSGTFDQIEDWLVEQFDPMFIECVLYNNFLTMIPDEDEPLLPTQRRITYLAGKLMVETPIPISQTEVESALKESGLMVEFIGRYVMSDRNRFMFSTKFLADDWLNLVVAYKLTYG